jgi:hypothetical protein
VTEELEHKIRILAETLKTTPEELIEKAVNSFLDQRCDPLERKKPSESSFPETKYTPSA